MIMQVEMIAGRKDWTREEHILAFNLCCKIPLGQQHGRALRSSNLQSP
jgi:hypothetical protein